MSYIIAVMVPNGEGAIQIIPSEGLGLSRTRHALSIALEAVREQEIRECIRAEAEAEEAKDDRRTRPVTESEDAVRREGD